MSKDTTEEVFLYNVTRTHSTMGNPRFRFSTDHGNFRTAENTMSAYGLENYFTLVEPINKNVLLTLSKGNKDAVYDWKVID